MSDGRYHQQRDVYLPMAGEALRSQFQSQADIEAFYARLASDEVRDEFLRIACFYHSLVKCGDWHLSSNPGHPVVDYLTETYKAVSLFSLIEAIGGPAHQDFYDWLLRERKLPIEDEGTLSKLHDEYKKTYGSVRRCVWFFSQFSPEQQQKLCRAVRRNGTPVEDVRQVAKFLYELRSKFVHQADLILQLSEATVVSRIKGKVVVCDVSLGDLLSAFEECMVKVFRERA